MEVEQQFLPGELHWKFGVGVSYMHQLENEEEFYQCVHHQRNILIIQCFYSPRKECPFGTIRSAFCVI